MMQTLDCIFVTKLLNWAFSVWDIGLAIAKPERTQSLCKTDHASAGPQRVLKRQGKHAGYRLAEIPVIWHVSFRP